MLREPVIQKSKHSVMKELAPYLNHGAQMVVTTLVIGAIGWFIDREFETSPIWTIVFLILGATGSLYNFFRDVLKADKSK